MDNEKAKLLEALKKRGLDQKIADDPKKLQQLLHSLRPISNDREPRSASWAKWAAPIDKFFYKFLESGGRFYDKLIPHGLNKAETEEARRAVSKLPSLEKITPANQPEFFRHLLRRTHGAAGPANSRGEMVLLIGAGFAVTYVLQTALKIFWGMC